MDKSFEAMQASLLAEMLPFIDDAGFSEEERQQVDTILMLLQQLTSFVEYFQTDLDIFDHAAAHPEIEMRWAPIACRDAALTLWDFRDALDHIQRALKRCPPLRTTDRERALRAVIGRYGAAFPDATPARVVAAHPVGHIGTPHARRTNAIKGTGVIVQNSRAGRKVMHSREGRIVSFEISDDTVRRLKEIRNAAFAVFRPAAPNPERT